MIEYSKEDLDRLAPNDEILTKIQEAIRRGDEEAEAELMQQLIIPAESLLATLASRGSDWIRDQGWNTSEAERVFGKDWLDRPMEELDEINFAR